MADLRGFLNGSRHGWPKPLNRALTGLLEYAPVGVLRALDRRRDRGAAGEVLHAPAAERRLYIGPANFAGQGRAWASAVERIPGAAAVNMAFSAGVFAYSADLVVPRDVYLHSAAWQRAQSRIVRDEFDHVLIEAERPLFGYYFGDIELEIAALQSAGVSVGLVCHGTDIRLPSRHAGREPNSPYREVPVALERTAAANLALIARLDLPVYVSTPDLLVDLPGAEWLPVAITPDAWSAPARALAARRPLVVHAPSKSQVKGTDLIEPALLRMHEEGVIEYRRAEGLPAHEMPAFYGSADIVLDQFRLGIYGVAACEAMASGRLVISHVSDQVRGEVRARTGLDLPIVESSGADIEHTLRAVLADREKYAAVAGRGPSFVHAVHDGGRSAAVLARFIAPAN